MRADHRRDEVLLDDAAEHETEYARRNRKAGEGRDPAHKTNCFETGSWLPDLFFILRQRRRSGNLLTAGHFAALHRMGRVNSRGERRPSERVSGVAPTRRGEQPSPEKGGIPGLQRADRSAERVSPKGVLAEGKRFELLVQGSGEHWAIAAWEFHGLGSRHAYPDGRGGAEPASSERR